MKLSVLVDEMIVCHENAKESTKWLPKLVILAKSQNTRLIYKSIVVLHIDIRFPCIRKSQGKPPLVYGLNSHDDALLIELFEYIVTGTCLYTWTGWKVIY